LSALVSWGFELPGHGPDAEVIILARLSPSVSGRLRVRSSLNAAGAWREELRQLLELLAARPLYAPQHRLHPLPWALPVPLRVHGHDSRDDAPWIHREGVLWHQPTQTDLLFISLRRSKALFSPSTRTRDLALGPSLLHWESQSTTTAASATGQRSIHHAARGSRVLLYRCAEAFGYLCHESNVLYEH
jgi:hypothetical protein